MKASDAKKFIGQLVEYEKEGWGKRLGVVVRTEGRNIIMDDDALWAPDISNMKLVAASNSAEGAHGEAK